MHVKFSNINTNVNREKPTPRNYNRFNNLKPLAQDTISFSGNPRISFHLEDAIKRKDSYDILENLGFDVAVQYNNANKLTVLEYGKPNEKYTFEDYGIDEEKLFNDIEKFEGETRLAGSKIRKLGKQEFEFLNIADKNIKEFDLGNAKIETLAIYPQLAAKLKYKNAQIENLYIIEPENIAKNLGKIIAHIEDEIYYFPDSETALATKRI